MTAKKVSCRNCPHTNQDHSLYNGEWLTLQGACLIDDCKCTRYLAGQLVDERTPICDNPTGGFSIRVIREKGLLTNASR